MALITGGQATSGGSQPLSLGTITANELATGGPKLLYTPAAGESIYGSAALNAVFCDVGQRVGIAPLADLPANDDTDFLVYFDNDLASSALVLWGIAAAAKERFKAVSDPLYAGWFTDNNNILVDVAPGTWQANHAYALNAWIIDSAGHFQHVTTAGTSGGLEPSWPASSGTTTTDGGVTWTDEGPVPQVGQIDLFVLSATP